MLSFYLFVFLFIYFNCIYYFFVLVILVQYYCVLYSGCVCILLLCINLSHTLFFLLYVSPVNVRVCAKKNLVLDEGCKLSVKRMQSVLNHWWKKSVHIHNRNTV